ncbi:hypothetical protein GF319_04495 [Candidatus Bathyarchaeota archaeon]|nr:hypothetical protein [Candidatus Bathyarchaeota archaeon]
MNPCRLCIKKYKETPCEGLGHCAFENSFELELAEEIDEDYRPTITAV